jgi:hypothetical protein
MESAPFVVKWCVTGREKMQILKSSLKVWTDNISLKPRRTFGFDDSTDKKIMVDA